MRLRTWPVAAKLVGLCVGVAAAVAIGLTSLGYTLASGGLKQQAEAALWSDGLLVATRSMPGIQKCLSMFNPCQAAAVRRALEAGRRPTPRHSRSPGCNGSHPRFG